jgi:uncharacterized protein
LTCYIDTSVLAAYYCPELLSEKAQSFLTEQVKLAVSELTTVEMFSAVARKVRMGELSPSDGNRILSIFTSHVDGGLFDVISLEPQHWRIARGWLGLFNTSLKTLDALHLAIASAGGLTLVSSDRHLLQAADSLGVVVHRIG